jgi:L-ascorbate metabolism protein UlaG (beta-lactamase superfamily)
MRITWQGLACFLIEGEAVSIATDPFTPGEFGYAPIDRPVDVVVRSSPDDDAHSAADSLKGSPALVDALDVSRAGPVTAKGVRFDAYRTRERLVAGKRSPGENAMYRFEVDGVRLLHVGDIGLPFSPDHLDALEGQVDVMLAITGDNYTISLDDLLYGIERIQPRIVIPMHYQDAKLRLPKGFWFYPLEAFTSRFPDDRIVRTRASTLEVTRSSLPERMTINILEAAG